LISEHDHGYRLSQPRVGHVHMKLLAHPRLQGVTLWDAGRELGPNVVDSFSLRGFEPGSSARLIIRAAPSQTAVLSVVVNGAPTGTVKLEPRDAWQEVAVTLTGDRVESNLDVRIEGKGTSRILHHLWAVQRR
jgi:hypothetical protein